MEDFEEIGRILLEVCKEIDEEFGGKDSEGEGKEKDVSPGAMFSDQSAFSHSDEKGAWVSECTEVVKYDHRRAQAMRNPIRWVMYLLGF